MPSASPLTTATAAQPNSVAHREEPRSQARVERHLAASEATVHVTVAQRSRAGEARELSLPGSDDPRTDVRRPHALARAPAHQLHRGHRLDLADEVDPVNERPAQAALIARELECGAAAAVGRPSAWAAIAGGHDDRVGREVQRALSAR